MRCAFDRHSAAATTRGGLELDRVALSVAERQGVRLVAFGASPCASTGRGIEAAGEQHHRTSHGTLSIRILPADDATAAPNVPAGKAAPRRDRGCDRSLELAPLNAALERALRRRCPIRSRVPTAARRCCFLSRHRRKVRAAGSDPLELGCGSWDASPLPLVRAGSTARRRRYGCRRRQCSRAAHAHTARSSRAPDAVARTTLKAGDFRSLLGRYDRATALR